MEIFSLKALPVYSALSYTWGPESPSHTIFVDGKTLSVRQNLFGFLQEIRHRKEEYFFIDQICIDQSNTSERNNQVQMMSQIYSNCQSVIVWLNDKEGRCGEAARIFSQDSSIEALATLLSNDYFSRLWIVQELLLARSISVFAAGHIWLDWETIWCVTKRINLNEVAMTAKETAAWKRVLPNTQKLIRMTGNGGQRKESKELLDILSFSANICQEPRDKVYGLMSLFEVEYQLDVNYQKPIYDVYIDVVMALHSIIKFELNQGYLQWLKATEQLGANMGIHSLDVAALFAFLGLVLPPQAYMAKRVGSCGPSLVSAISVEVKMKKTGLRPQPSQDSLAQSKDSLTRADEGVRTMIENATAAMGVQPTFPKLRGLITDHYLGLPPDLRWDQDSDDDANDDSTDSESAEDDNAIVRSGYNIVREVLQYQKNYRKSPSSLKAMMREQRWNLFVQSINDTASLRHKNLHLSWSFRHEGSSYTYKTPPRWEDVFRMPPMTMARIMRQCLKERKYDVKARMQQYRKHMGIPYVPVDRDVPSAVYRWFTLALVIAMVVVVLSFAAESLNLYIALVVLGFWGCFRFARSEKVTLLAGKAAGATDVPVVNGGNAD